MVPFRTAVRAWFGISLQTFGGPARQVAVMQHALVDERRWISQRRFMHPLNYCTLLPGPEAHQLGWLLNGLRGGLVAGVLFVLPGSGRAARAVLRCQGPPGSQRHPCRPPSPLRIARGSVAALSARSQVGDGTVTARTGCRKARAGEDG